MKTEGWIILIIGIWYLNRNPQTVANIKKKVKLSRDRMLEVDRFNPTRPDLEGDLIVGGQSSAGEWGG